MVDKSVISEDLDVGPILDQAKRQSVRSFWDAFENMPLTMHSADGRLAVFNADGTYELDWPAIEQCAAAPPPKHAAWLKAVCCALVDLRDMERE